MTIYAKEIICLNEYDTKLCMGYSIIYYSLYSLYITLIILIFIYYVLINLFGNISIFVIFYGSINLTKQQLQDIFCRQTVGRSYGFIKHLVYLSAVTFLIHFRTRGSDTRENKPLVLQF